MPTLAVPIEDGQIIVDTVLRVPANGPRPGAGDDPATTAREGDTNEDKKTDATDPVRPAAGTDAAPATFALYFSDDKGLQATTLEAADFEYTPGPGSANTATSTLTLSTAAIAAGAKSLSLTVALPNALVAGDRQRQQDQRSGRPHGADDHGPLPGAGR